MFRLESKAQSEKLQPWHSSVRRADRDDLHLADGMVHPPNDGMRAENNDLPVTTVCSKSCKVAVHGDVVSEGFKP